MSQFETPFSHQTPLFYYAPELFDIEDAKNNEPSSIKFNRVCVWIIGIIISELISGVIPWQNVSTNETKVKLCINKKKPFPIPDVINSYPEIKDLIEKCTKIIPNDRCNIDYIVESLRKINTIV